MLQDVLRHEDPAHAAGQSQTHSHPAENSAVSAEEVQDAVTFYVRTGTYNYAHPECVLLSLVSSESEDDRRSAVSKVQKLRGDREYGDTEFGPRISPKLDLTATILQELISWQPDQEQKPVFTYSLTRKEIDMIQVKPYDVPGFSIHTQSIERAVKQLAEAVAAAVGQQARDGFIRARTHYREAMPSFSQKKDIISTFWF